MFHFHIVNLSHILSIFLKSKSLQVKSIVDILLKSLLGLFSTNNLFAFSFLNRVNVFFEILFWLDISCTLYKFFSFFITYFGGDALYMDVGS